MAWLLQSEPIVRLFDILRKEGVEYVSQDDLKSMMAGILLSHPGLEFLQETPEFQDRCRPRCSAACQPLLSRHCLGPACCHRDPCNSVYAKLHWLHIPQGLLLFLSISAFMKIQACKNIASALHMCSYACSRRSHAELMHRYAETVIYRIFYALDRSNIGRLTLRDLRR